MKYFCEILGYVLVRPVCAQEFRKDFAKKKKKKKKIPIPINVIPSALVFEQECKHLACASLEQEGE